MKTYIPPTSFDRERQIAALHAVIALKTLKGLQAIKTLKDLTGNIVILKPMKR